MVQYQAKAQPVGDPSDWVEPVFFDGWWVEADPVRWELPLANVGPSVFFAGDPDGFTAADFSTFGWEQPTQQPVDLGPETRFTMPSVFFEGEPSDFVEPVFFDAWNRQPEQPRVAGIPPITEAVFHIVADEDFAAEFSTFGWERPTELPRWELVDYSQAHQWAFAPDYESIISTPDLVDFVGWNPITQQAPIPEDLRFTIPSVFYESDPDTLNAGTPLGYGPLLAVVTNRGKNRATVTNAGPNTAAVTNRGWNSAEVV